MSLALLFLNTPNMSKNIIDKDKKISGNTNCKFSIIIYSLIYNYTFQLNLKLILQ